jgi:CHAT domain-containing protein
VLITDKTNPTAGANEKYREARWLIARQPITILPSVASLRSLRQSARTSQASRAYLGFGNPLLDGDGVTRTHIERASAARQTQCCPGSPRLTRITSPLERLPVRPLARGGLANLTELKSQLPLPETTDEICAVAANFGASSDDVRLGARATEREIKELSANGQLTTYRILHFATHGAVSGGVEGNAEPGLILTPPR